MKHNVSNIFCSDSFTLFASNGVFVNYFWIPIALPVNAILAYGNSRATQIIWTLIG
ncbi:hypothetical protein ACVR0I_07955 [Streptococcus macedonicus]|uniref:hypothetical protein n=1 Tax=Streptococcus macedonicus TaxID=59310 RepID=UPI00202A1134|nr:hypothetical protein [Streptococcus macedonicus]